MAIKTSKSQEMYFAKYKANKTQEVNRKIKLQRRLKAQPNNLQLPLALKNVSYRRKTPVTPQWSHQQIATAMLMKHFTGAFDKNIFNPDPKKSDPAVRVRNQNIFEHFVVPPVPKYSMFSIMARVVAQDSKALIV